MHPLQHGAAQTRRLESKAAAWAGAAGAAQACRRCIGRLVQLHVVPKGVGAPAVDILGRRVALRGGAAQRPGCFHARGAGGSGPGSAALAQGRAGGRRAAPGTPRQAGRSTRRMFFWDSAQGCRRRRVSHRNSRTSPTRVKGFHSPAAPCEVVSSYCSATSVTAAPGSDCLMRRAAVRPITPPPTTQIRAWPSAAAALLLPVAAALAATAAELHRLKRCCACLVSRASTVPPH